ncbi:RUN domain-containing protein [Reticulomyxa filosa]|uniref:RUN domain-containing protein n=1 Tax=Reticulomyxa filosa TaxID=46433 RepID=X6NG22_RETFI|nr:RUN domain-containing protein [Reticulomyxa filosa]|eukprot:ETO24287.1 RUN domain-containing protein [Reticulomyxa filosa]
MDGGPIYYWYVKGHFKMKKRKEKTKKQKCEHGRAMRLKQIPRFDVDAIRPYLPPESNKSTSSTTNDKETTSDASSKERTAPLPKPALVKDTNQLDQIDLDAQIRASWTRGAVVEVYSRGKKRWMRGMIERVFVDDEGEWLEIRYGANLVKETPRNSPDIRPLRPRFKNTFTFTVLSKLFFFFFFLKHTNKQKKKKRHVSKVKDHVSKIMAVWEDVDLEGTRHLDSILLEAVFRAFNLKLKVDELDKVFRWIDVDNREAITAEQFIAWMTDSTETLEQKDLQKRMFDGIDRTVSGELPMSQSLEQEEKEKVKTLTSPSDRYNSNNGGNNNSTNNNNNGPEVSITSIFRPAPVVAKGGDDQQRRVTNNRYNADHDDHIEEEKSDEENHALGADENEILNRTLAEFSDKEDDDDVVGELPSFSNVANQPSKEDEVLSLAQKLERLGFNESYLRVSPTDEQHEYIPKTTQKKIEAEDKFLRKLMKEVQDYIKMRVEKAGVEGIGMYDLGQFVHQKFPNFDRSNYIKGKNGRFADFVYLTPGLVVLQMEDGSGNLDRIAVTEEVAKKINLKQKLEFVMKMVCDKTKIDNDLTIIRQANHDRYGRRLSVGEKLLTAHDFGARMVALGTELTDLERDELFWAVAGNHAHLVSAGDIGKYFGELVEELPQSTDTVVAALPRLISLARLKYRRQPLWNNYIIKRCRKRWNNVSLVTVLDRHTRLKQMDMVMIPRTSSSHGEDLLSVQRSFHYMCHVLNKLQYNTVIKKLYHGADKFAYSCVTESPTVRSFPDVLLEAKNRSIGYSEHFVAQVVGSLMETVVFCHKHNCVNLNLNIGTRFYALHSSSIFLFLLFKKN